MTTWLDKFQSNLLEVLYRGQPRDELGRWTSGGAGASGGDDPPVPYSPAKYIGLQNCIDNMPFFSRLSQMSSDEFFNIIKNDLDIKDGQDLWLKEVLQDQGFDGKPRVVSKEELDAKVAEGWTEVHRGVQVPEYAEQFKTGELFVSCGCIINGTFVAKDDPATGTTGVETAKMYAQGGHSLIPDAGPTVGTGVVMRMAIDPDAKIRSYKEIVESVQNMRETKQFDTRSRHALTNQAIHAACTGYDIVDIGADGYMLILNRTAVMIQED